MADISPISSSTNWPSTRAVNSSYNGKHSPNQHQKHKKDNESDDDSVGNLNDSGLNPKKKPPDSSINIHIDEYV